MDGGVIDKAVVALVRRQGCSRMLAPDPGMDQHPPVWQDVCFSKSPTGLPGGLFVVCSTRQVCPQLFQLPGLFAVGVAAVQQARQLG